MAANQARTQDNSLRRLAVFGSRRKCDALFPARQAATGLRKIMRTGTQGDAYAAPRALHQRCVGCDRKDSAGSQRGACGLHTVTGRNSRHRKGLEPSRRLSERNGPRPSGAFRVVFPAPEVTERGARCKRAWRFLTHRAPGGEAAIGRVHSLPARTGNHRTCSLTAVSSCTCYRSARARRATSSAAGADGGIGSGADATAEARAVGSRRITRTSLDTTAGRSARAGGREAGTGGEERSEAPGKRATRGRRQIEAEIERSEIAADNPAAKRVAQDHRTVHRSGLDVRHPGRQARHSHAARCGNAVSARSQCTTLTPRAMSVRI